MSGVSRLSTGRDWPQLYLSIIHRTDCTLKLTTLPASPSQASRCLLASATTATLRLLPRTLDVLWVRSDFELYLCAYFTLLQVAVASWSPTIGLLTYIRAFKTGNAKTRSYRPHRRRTISSLYPAFFETSTSPTHTRLSRLNFGEKNVVRCSLLSASCPSKNNKSGRP